MIPGALWANWWARGRPLFMRLGRGGVPLGWTPVLSAPRALVTP